MHIEKIAKQTGLPEDKVSLAFTLTMESVMKEHFNVDNLHVDLEDKIVEIIFRVPVDMEYNEALELNDAVLLSDPLYVLLDLKAFPPKLVNRIRNRLKAVLDEIKLAHEYDIWKKRVHTLVEGVVTDFSDDHQIEIDLGGIVGIFPKANWVPRENNLYRKGNSLFFYIQKVERQPLKIYLSRRSLNLPALLLKHHLPWNKFVCRKRWLGGKCFVFTDAPLDAKFAEIRDRVSQELNGELLEVRRFEGLLQ